MNFEFSDEQQEIRRTLREFLLDRAPISKTREWMASPEACDRDFWQAMANELGLQGLVVPERYGGTGYGAVELTVVMEELGRALVCAPFFSTVALAVQALLALGDDEARQRWLPELVSGQRVATLALTERSGRWDALGVETRAERIGQEFALSGEKTFVTAGACADLILVVARVDDDLHGIFALERPSAGLRVDALPSLDQARPMARLALGRARALPIGPPVSWHRIQRVLDLASAALVAEQVGAAARVLEMAVEHAKVREQFGRPIGSFQAIKHKCADMLLRVEAARSAAYYAGWVASRVEGGAGEGALRSVASIAKADVSEAFLHVAEENLQIHGGLGFTWEQDPHLYLKRARSSYSLLGDPAYHRSLTAAELLD